MALALSLTLAEGLRAQKPAWEETTAGLGSGWVQPVAAGGGLAGMVVQVELLEAGGMPQTQAVEVWWPEVTGVSGWWLLATAPLLLVLAAQGRQRRGLRRGRWLR